MLCEELCHFSVVFPIVEREPCKEFIFCFFGFLKRVHIPKIFMGTHYSLLCMGTDIDCFECLVCGYIYDPEAGDPGGGIPSGVKFLSLPDDWLCPECSAGKDEFALVEL